MTETDPIALLFGEMTKLGPGSDEDTLAVLRRLPDRRCSTVVDAGCGAGRQTLVLAKELQTQIHAVDSHEPFLNQLAQCAAEAGLSDLVQPHVLDMQDIPSEFPRIDLLWCEGAAYHLGFSNALAKWVPAIVPGGFLVVSELTWLKDSVPERARNFFAAVYPAMQSDSQNRASCRQAGFSVSGTHVLPESAWRDDYYDVLLPRARRLVEHSDAKVRELATGMLEEIAVFSESAGSFGYVFYLLQRDQ